jgi:hypothetical protein
MVMTLNLLKLSKKQPDKSTLYIINNSGMQVLMHESYLLCKQGPIIKRYLNQASRKIKAEEASSIYNAMSHMLSAHEAAKPKKAGSTGINFKRLAEFGTYKIKDPETRQVLPETYTTLDEAVKARESVKSQNPGKTYNVVKIEGDKAPRSTQKIPEKRYWKRTGTTPDIQDQNRWKTLMNEVTYMSEKQGAELLQALEEAISVSTASMKAATEAAGNCNVSNFNGGNARQDFVTGK